MEDIASLAAEKPFAALTAPEQEQVLALMPAADFDNLYEVLKRARALDADAAPPAALGMRLQQHMARQTRTVEKTSIFQRVISIRIPVWQVAAGIALAFFIGRSIHPGATTGEVAPAIVQTVIKTDTVFLEKVQWKERVVIHERFATAPIPTPGNTAAAELADPISPENPIPEMPIEISGAGSPIGAQPELFQFFTQPDSK